MDERVGKKVRVGLSEENSNIHMKESRVNDATTLQGAHLPINNLEYTTKNKIVPN